MPLRCHVKGCKKNNEKDKKHSFFRQPSNLELRKKWQEFAEVEGNPSHLRICSDHFEPNIIRKKYPRPLLVRGAIPTLRKPVSSGGSNESDPKNDYDDNKLEFRRSSRNESGPKINNYDDTLRFQRYSPNKFYIKNENYNNTLDFKRSPRDESDSQYDFYDHTLELKQSPRNESDLKYENHDDKLESKHSLPNESDKKNDNYDNVLEFQRAPFREDCSHQPKGMILDVEQATADQPTIIRIQTNETIRVVISDIKCSCKI